MKLLRKLIIGLFCRPKFEYKTLRWSKEYRSFEQPDELTELGKQGWECFHVNSQPSADLFFLKRRV